MITPEQIRRKAQALYRRALSAMVTGEEIFPYVIRANKALPRDTAAAIKAIETLRQHSKQFQHAGYSVQWREINSARFGRNPFPDRIYFEHADDLVAWLNKRNEFDRVRKAISKLRAELPELLPWMQSNVAALVDCSAVVDGLIEVAKYFRNHPAPGLFARQLPLSVDTKFIESYQRILRAWLDILLPPDAIRADQNQFERRFGLRWAEPHVMVRLLDIRLADELRLPWTEFSLPLAELAALGPRHGKVIIVENKVNLLTLAQAERTIGLGGLGMGIGLLRDVNWLADNTVYYWGDIDIEGFEILSQLRGFCPQATSFMMDEQALRTYRHLAVERNPRQVRPPAHLQDGERSAFEICQRENLRIEQERIPVFAIN